jgi:hypothetical protein
MLTSALMWQGFTTADLLEAIQEKADSEAAERAAGGPRRSIQDQ